MRLLHTILSLVFPLKCVVCGADGKDLCLECLEEFPVAERESEWWMFPLWDYRHPPLKKAIWQFKYGGKRRLAQALAMPLFENLSEEIAELEVMKNFREPLLVPIPLSRKRFRERGYNQSELLSKEVIKISLARGGPNLELRTDILLKPRETEHQARIKDRREREKNMKGTFLVARPEEVRKRNVILIDDILTTGATLTEAKRVLKEAGARYVVAFTVAH